MSQAVEETPRQRRARKRQERRERREQERRSAAAREAKRFEDPLKLVDRYKRPANMRDYWKNSSAFYVCGGPSLRSIDLNVLRERGVVSLGVNNVAGYAPVTAFTCSDPPSKFHHGIWMDPCMMKFVPVPKLGKKVRIKLDNGLFANSKMRVRDCPGVMGYERICNFEAARFFDTEGATWGNNDAALKARGIEKGTEEHMREKLLFSFFLGLRLLHYLGVRRVFMIGVDFHMTSGQSGYAFNQGRDSGAAMTNNGSYSKAMKWCQELVPVFAERNFEVFNCNPNSALRCFPFVSFDDALAECRGYVPAEPFDLSGWYEKDDGTKKDNLKSVKVE